MKLEVNIDMLKKYSRPGPRYTSYPTAPHFSSAFREEDYRKEIEESNRNPNLPLSLYFHLPFCKTLCYYCGCNMMITHSSKKIDDYIDWLEKEMALLAPLIHPERKVSQLHWGGGSPDYLSPEQIERLFHRITKYFSFCSESEIGIEIDPRRLTETHLSTIRRLGFNRISFGVQDFDEKVQKAVNRIQSEELTRRVVEEARELGFHSINLDLIYGLPYQTLESYQRTLEKILQLSPDRLAVFHYAHVPWLKKHQKMIPQEALPSTEEKLKMVKMIIETLTSAGYVYIGMDHFAKEDDPLTKALREKSLHRNFQGYTTFRGAEIYGFGITSISQLQNAYIQNVKLIPPYQGKLEKGKLPVALGRRLTKDDQIRRYVIIELMCNSLVQKRDVENRFGISFDSYFAKDLPKLEEFIKDGLVQERKDSILVTEAGRLVIRNIAMCFDAYLKNNQENMYSKTI
ncbi:MAG: oxygen-independent coproporphyrinogen III oxidase [Planctomycetota bacterium]|nr:MAG: oxygen-independent coproporphyrinogen III oxidase [Planctomycetota bacterium]